MLAGTIGIYEGIEPLVCASSGQEVRGRHANTYSIEGTNAYYRVLAKRVETWDGNPDNHTNLVKEYKSTLTKKTIIEPVKEVK